MSSPFEQVSKALEPLVDQPVMQRLLSEASSMRDRTMRLQEAALGALNLPTASDLTKLERRIRGLAESLERLEDHLDRVEARLRTSQQSAAGSAEIDELRSEIAALRAQLAGKD
jgi:predicted  nucleic acid-binding Zn-ribbon protein